MGIKEYMQVIDTYVGGIDQETYENIIFNLIFGG